MVPLAPDLPSAEDPGKIEELEVTFALDVAPVVQKRRQIWGLQQTIA
ncbi:MULTISPECIES: hypothetical protein [Aminobacterium]|jgi:hypothetical protein|nr:hypothetical protein [Aminobacterium sp. UBA4908]